MAGPSWTYAELNYVTADSADPATGEDKWDGYGIEGSIEFFDVWHASLNLSSVDTGSNIVGDIDTTDFRVGLHPAVTDSTDLYLELGYTSYDLDQGGPLDTPSEVILAAGIRSMLSDKVEVRAGLTYAQGDYDADSGFGSDDYTDSRFNVGGGYYFTDNLSVDVDYTTVQDGMIGSGGQDIFELGVRWNFGDFGLFN
jgi:hypothetical protein